MIPQKKKNPEEIAALRQGLGIPGSPVSPTQKPEIAVPPRSVPAADSLPKAEAEQIATDQPLSPSETGDPVIHLDLPTLTASSKTHRLRRHEMPLAPAPAVSRKTELPTHRHDPRDIAQIRKREALAQMQTPGMDPAARLREQTASPFLYLPGYLLPIAAGAVTYQRVHHVTPIVLLALALLITLYIAMRKPRSRHHAALMFILVFLTAAFGGVHYAPLFYHGP